MANKKTILSEEIELSEIVLKKTNQAFEMIKQEDIVSMKKHIKEEKKCLKHRLPLQQASAYWQLAA